MTSAAVGILGGPELVSYLPILEGTNPVKDLITSSIGKIENVLFFYCWQLFRYCVCRRRVDFYRSNQFYSTPFCMRSRRPQFLTRSARIYIPAHAPDFKLLISQDLVFFPFLFLFQHLIERWGGRFFFPPLAKVFGVIWASDEVNNIIIDKDFYFKRQTEKRADR